MLESKVPYKLPGGNTGGRPTPRGVVSFHYDFVNGWISSASNKLRRALHQRRRQ